METLVAREQQETSSVKSYSPDLHWTNIYNSATLTIDYGMGFFPVDAA